MDANQFNLREKNIKIKALEVAQGLCMLYHDGKRNQKNAEHVIEQIYKCTHVALGECPNKHKDWLEGLNKIHESLRGTYLSDE